MKKLITVILICFSLCSCGQTLQKVFNNSITQGIYPIINAHKKDFSFLNLGTYNLLVQDSIYGQMQYTDQFIAPAYFSMNSTQFTSDTSLVSSDITSSAFGLSTSAYANSTNTNRVHTLLIDPNYIKLQSGVVGEKPIKLIAKVPTMEEITITDIAVWDNDTLKRVHLSVPLTVQGFQKLITAKWEE